jgi:hypothetical protein
MPAIRAVQLPGLWQPEAGPEEAATVFGFQQSFVAEAARQEAKQVFTLFTALGGWVEQESGPFSCLIPWTVGPQSLLTKLNPGIGPWYFILWMARQVPIIWILKQGPWVFNKMSFQKGLILTLDKWAKTESKGECSELILKPRQSFSLLLSLSLLYSPQSHPQKTLFSFLWPAVAAICSVAAAFAIRRRPTAPFAMARAAGTDRMPLQLTGRMADSPFAVIV